jgi:BirA family biotin operon repressor/biotin-[acetyl-CoA-carboxylase] ligase
VLAGTPDRLDEIELAPHLTGTWRRIVWHAETDSTQRVARDLANAGAEEGTIVIAETQSAGRGRLGRTWHSPPGKNLYFSVVLRPMLPPSTVPQLALVAGLAMARAIETLGLCPAIKWPNDVLVDGRKAVGVITEMHAELERVQAVIPGIGVNVNATAADFPPHLRETATSLALVAGRPIDRVRFAAAAIDALEADYRRFVAGGFAALRAEWERRSALAGRSVTVRWPDGEVAGTVAGIDDDGALRVVDAAGTAHRVLAGDVTLRPSG